MELYGDCELEEIEQEQDPEIAKQTEKIEKSGFDSINKVEFSIYKRLINGKSRKSSVNRQTSTGSYNGSHPASLRQASSINEDSEQQDNGAVVVDSAKHKKQGSIIDTDILKDKLKQLLFNEEYPVQYGKQYSLNQVTTNPNETVVVTITMIKNQKDIPMGIGWCDEHTVFEYDENKNGIQCDFIYDAVPTLSLDSIKGEKKMTNNQAKHKFLNKNY